MTKGQVAVVAVLLTFALNVAANLLANQIQRRMDHVN